MKETRSLNHRNFIGWFVGGVFGILLIGLAGTFVGLLGCLAGFFCGFYYDRIWQHARSSWQEDRERTRALRPVMLESLLYNRFWIYLGLTFACIDSMMLPSGNGLVENVENASLGLGGFNIFVTLAASIMLGPLFSVVFRTAIMASVDGRRDADSDHIFEWLTEKVLEMFVLAVFILPQGIKNRVAGGFKWCTTRIENFQTLPEARLKWAHGIARSVFSLFWIGLLVEVFILAQTRGHDLTIGSSLFVIMSIFVGLMMSTDLDANEQEHAEAKRLELDNAALGALHVENRLARRLETLERYGFIRYTAGFTARMFSIICAGLLVLVWTLFVLTPIFVLWALVLAMPFMFMFMFMFVYLFVKNLPRVSDGTHWTGMITTIVTTGVAVFTLGPHLVGTTLLIVAFANGLICGALSVGICMLAGKSHTLVPAFARFSRRFETGTKAFDHKMIPVVSRIDSAMTAGPLCYFMCRLQRDPNFGL